jgi:integrase
VRHHPALPYAEAPQFMADLSAATGTAASMLYFLIFTACRTNEAVDARWSEIDRPSSTWKIPGERMKMQQDHVVPLSDPALAILDKMRDATQDELIFPNPDNGIFSENAMLAVLDRLGYLPHLTSSHGRLGRHETGLAIQRLMSDSCHPVPLVLILSWAGNVPSAILR